MGLLYEIEYLRELLPWVGDTLFNYMSRSSPLVAMPHSREVLESSWLLVGFPICNLFVATIFHSLLLVACFGWCPTGDGLLLLMIASVVQCNSDDGVLLLQIVGVGWCALGDGILLLPIVGVM